jgi:ribosomal protein L11 methyltransferase
VPYRIDLRHTGSDGLDRLVELGALDAEVADDGRIAALMPDAVRADEVARALGVEVSVSRAIGRDEGSVWVLSRRPIHVGRLRILPAHLNAEPGAIRLAESDAFGSGLHPTTSLCLEAIDEAIATAAPDTLLDVGTGSGVLALAALTLGTQRALGIDVDEQALRAAADNARLNALDDRLRLVHGGPDAVAGTFPFIVANVLAAPLIEMAPSLVRRVGHHGLLVLSGIAAGLENDVEHAYQHLGMQRMGATVRSGWAAMMMRASW